MNPNYAKQNYRDGTRSKRARRRAIDRRAQRAARKAVRHAR